MKECDRFSNQSCQRLPKNHTLMLMGLPYCHHHHHFCMCVELLAFYPFLPCLLLLCSEHHLNSDLLFVICSPFFYFLHLKILIFFTCQNVVKCDGSGKKGKLSCWKCIFDQIKANLAKIQSQNHQNVQKNRIFGQKLQESMGLTADQFGKINTILPVKRN